MKQMMLPYYTDGMIDYFIILYMMLLQEFESIARPSGFYETLLTLAYKCQFGVEARRCCCAVEGHKSQNRAKTKN